MASIFDSPLFWIIVVWWLLSTLLGAKARQRRAMQARSKPPDQPPALSEEARPEDESAVSPLQEGPAEFEAEGEVLEAQPVTETPEPREYPARARPTPPSKPATRLEDLFRGLGITEDMIPPALRPEREAVPPEEPGPAPAEMPEIAPEPELAEAPSEPLPIKPPPTPVKGYVAAPPPRRYHLLAESTQARLTSLQQAIVLKEVLDRPRAQRRAIR